MYIKLMSVLEYWKLMCFKIKILLYYYNITFTYMETKCYC